MPVRTHDAPDAQHREVRLSAWRPYVRNGTTVTFTGLDADDHEVTFACDWRVAQDLIHALYEDEEPIALVEDFQILSRTAPELPTYAPVDTPPVRLLDAALTEHLTRLAF